jgi:hypothetical protein
MKDFYDILGVSKGSSEAEIKKVAMINLVIQLLMEWEDSLAITQ